MCTNHVFLVTCKTYIPDEAEVLLTSLVPEKRKPTFKPFKHQRTL